jgi:hypothetical protein
VLRFAGIDSRDGNYVYFVFRQIFDLTGYDLTTADLKFKWGCDDVPSTGAVGWAPGFSLNGAALQGTGTCGTYALGGEIGLSSGFINGFNTLDFFVEGNGQTDGLDLANATFSASPTGGTVPEPMFLALVSAGLVGLVAMSRRRKV